MISRLVLLWIIGLPLLLAQSLQQQDILRLARIKSAIRKHLDGMPNYTCLQTVERYRRLPDGKNESLIDVLRLEVAYVAGRELIAWPGSTRFEDTELRDIVSTGAFSTGSFALHARAIFLGDGTTFSYSGEEIFEGKPAWRFNYATAQFRSGYQIRNPKKGIRAAVAYHGSIWADRRNYDLLRIAIETGDIPPEIEIEQARDQLDYQLMKIGTTEALLPRQSEIQITDNKGNVGINRTRLSRCKQYSGESTLSFEDTADVVLENVKPQRILVFEPHTEFELALDRAIDHESSAIWCAASRVTTRRSASCRIVKRTGASTERSNRSSAARAGAPSITCACSSADRVRRSLTVTGVSFASASSTRGSFCTIAKRARRISCRTITARMARSIVGTSTSSVMSDAIARLYAV